MKAVAKGKNLQISLKDSILISRKIKGMKLDKARKFLENLVNKKVSIEGKYYTKTAKKFLEILKQAEANAKNKNLNTERLFVEIAKADKGEKRLKSGRWGLREGKSTNLEIVVVER